jgi:hypothetical protein
MVSTVKVTNIDTPDNTGNITFDRPIVGDGSNLTGVGVDGIVSSADATAITITSAEKVGIGITNPNSTLVVSDGGAYGMEFYPNDSSVSKILAYDRTGSAYRDFKISANQVIFGYGTAGSNEGMIINNVGAVTTPQQPSFSACISTNQANVTGDGTAVTLTGAFWNETGTHHWDVGNCFSNGTFTAPVTGKYLLWWKFYIHGGLNSSHTQYRLDLNMQNGGMMAQKLNPYDMAHALADGLFMGSGVYLFDATDTCTWKITVSGSTKLVDIGYDSYAYSMIGGILLG